MATHFEDLVQFAIEQEIDAAELYEKYAVIVKDRGTKRLLEEMAVMEREHEQRLKKFKETSRDLFVRIGEVPDMHISDYLVEKELTENSSIQDVFIFAMKAEQKAYELYSRLSIIEPDLDKLHLFEELAEEEKKHKLDLETEYENIFMKDN